MDVRIRYRKKHVTSSVLLRGDAFCNKVILYICNRNRDPLYEHLCEILNQAT